MRTSADDALPRPNSRPMPPPMPPAAPPKSYLVPILIGAGAAVALLILLPLGLCFLGFLAQLLSAGAG